MASPASGPSDQDAANQFGRKVAIGCAVFLTAIVLTVMTWVIVWNRMANAHKDQLPSNGLPPPKITAPPPAVKAPGAGK
jgi:hypothetical protein